MGVSAHILFTAYKTTHSNRKLEEIRIEVLNSEAKKEDLKNQVSYKKTKDYVERTAREELNMSRLGEEIYLYPKELELNSESKSGSEAKKEEEQKGSVSGVGRKAEMGRKMGGWEEYTRNWEAWKRILF